MIPQDKQVVHPGSEGREASVAAGVDFLEGYISEHDYARRRGISLRTAQRDRQLRQSPPFTVLGRKIYYRIEALKEWLLSQERKKDRAAIVPRARKPRSKW